MGKKLVMGLVAVATAAGVYLGAVHFSGGAFPSPGFLSLGAERGLMRRITTSFWEDIQFKDFVRAAQYHAPEVQNTVDIPFILQRLFQVKPEALDIMNYEIVFADLDSTNNRGRVKSRVKFKDLLRGDIREQEIILYFERAGPASPWYMKLEDSLRQLDPTSGKKS